MSALLLRKISWVSLGFAAQQVIKLGTNVILATIIGPAVFGVMLILNTLRTGVEQISDVGIGQNIVFDPEGSDPRFYNAAWTIQILRGVFLFCIFLLVSPLLAGAFAEADLDSVLILFAPVFLISGLASPAIFLLQKDQKVGTIVKLQIATSILNGGLAIGFALYSPTADALVMAILVNVTLSAFITTFFMNFRSLRLSFDLAIWSKIVFFGKWVFLSTLLHFAASSFDRFYLAAVVPITLLGIYGIAKTFSEAAFQLASRISSLIIFPTVASAHHKGSGAVDISSPRKYGVLIAGVLVGCGMAASDLVIDVLYDARYDSARFILPVLLLGTWFSILSTINESIVYGSGKPAINAGANAVKFGWLVGLVPFAFAHVGLLGALLIIGLSAIPRYLVLALMNRANRAQFVLQDFAGTAAMIVTASLVRWAIIGLGLAEQFLPVVPTEILAI